MSVVAAFAFIATSIVIVVRAQASTSTLLPVSGLISGVIVPSVRPLVPVFCRHLDVTPGPSSLVNNAECKQYKNREQPVTAIPASL
jgi:hypothetical protein